MEILLFYVPVGSREDALALGQAAIERGLAACANCLPGESAYFWDGQLQQDNETILLLKTFPEFETSLSDFLSVRHAYEVPAILRWTVRVNAAYGEWMRSVMVPKKNPD